jgi:hypothetical protein
MTTEELNLFRKDVRAQGTLSSFIGSRSDPKYNNVARNTKIEVELTKEIDRRKQQ